MKTTVKRILSGLSGLMVGAITYYFMYGWHDVFPWAIAALAVGYLSKSRRSSIINGAIFGYFLFLVYIFAGYKGKTDTNAMVRFILFDVLFSLVGAVAGGLGALIGNWFRQRLSDKA